MTPKSRPKWERPPEDPSWLALVILAIIVVVLLIQSLASRR